MNTEIIIGVLGAGRIGKLHIENIRQTIPGIRIKSLVDFNIDEVSEWAKSMGISNLSSDPDIIFNDEEIQAVLILTPTDTHTDYIIKSAQAKKDIFCEKPIGDNLHKIQQAMSIVKEAGVKLMIGFNRRYDHNFSRVRKVVEDGEIGEPHIIKITSRDPAPPPLDFVKHSGGLFFDMTIHDWDMARYLAGDDVVEVYATGRALIDPSIADIDIDTAVATLKYKGGAMAIVDNSRQAKYGYDQRVEVFGSEGGVWVENDIPNTVKIYTSEAIKRDKMHYFFLQRYMQSFTDEMKAFFKCLRENTPPPIDGEDGLNAVLIAMAALKSLKENRPVKISEIE